MARDPYAGLRPKRAGPWLALVSGGFMVGGVESANDPRYGPWYLLVAPAVYAICQWIFRLMRDVEGLPSRRRNWLFIP